MGKQYASVEEMVRDLSEPEFADDFERNIRRKDFIAQHGRFGWRFRLIALCCIPAMALVGVLLVIVAIGLVFSPNRWIDHLTSDRTSKADEF